jgi:hypothetical protein
MFEEKDSKFSKSSSVYESLFWIILFFFSSFSVLNKVEKRRAQHKTRIFSF